MRKKASSKGGLVRVDKDFGLRVSKIPTYPLKSINQVVDLLGFTLNSFLQGKMTKSKATGIGYLSNILIGAIKGNDFEQRLEVVENVIGISKRIKKAYQFLPTKLKFKVLIEAKKRKQDCSLILEAITKEEWPAIKSLWDDFSWLLFLYYERLVLGLKQQVISTREGWKGQTDLTLMSVRENIRLLEALERLNKHSVGNKYLADYCSDGKQELGVVNNMVFQTKEVIEKGLEAQNELQKRLVEIQEQIQATEIRLGFEYPLKEDFEAELVI